MARSDGQRDNSTLREKVGLRRVMLRRMRQAGVVPVIIEAYGGTGEVYVECYASVLFTLADAYAPRDPVTYIVADLFPLPSLSIVYGAPGCFKSMLLADMGLCVAAGLPWLPPLPDGGQVVPRATVSVPVLWVDFDNGKARTNERLEALGRSRDMSEELPFYYACMPTPWLDGSDPLAVDRLIRLADSLSVGLIVIDNLGVVSGSADENSNEMVQILSNFRRLSEETGAAVVLVHHQRKTTGYKARTGESLRGFSGIEAALDLAVLVEREDGADSVMIQNTKARGGGVLPFGAVFAYDRREGTAELARAQFYGKLVLDMRKPAKAKRAILEVMEEALEPLNQRALTGLAKEICEDVGVNYYRNTIAKLVSEGELVEVDGPKQAKLYSLPL